MLITRQQEKELLSLLNLENQRADDSPREPADKNGLLQYLCDHANTGRGWHQLADDLDDHVLAKIVGLFIHELGERKGKSRGELLQLMR